MNEQLSHGDWSLAQWIYPQVQSRILYQTGHLHAEYILAHDLSKDVHAPAVQCCGR